MAIRSQVSWCHCQFHAHGVSLQPHMNFTLHAPPSPTCYCYVYQRSTVSHSALRITRCLDAVRTPQGLRVEEGCTLQLTASMVPLTSCRCWTANQPAARFWWTAWSAARSWHPARAGWTANQPAARFWWTAWSAARSWHPARAGWTANQPAARFWWTAWSAARSWHPALKAFSCIDFVDLSLFQSFFETI